MNIAILIKYEKNKKSVNNTFKIFNLNRNLWNIFANHLLCDVIFRFECVTRKIKSLPKNFLHLHILDKSQCPNQPKLKHNKLIWGASPNFRRRECWFFIMIKSQLFMTVESLIFYVFFICLLYLFYVYCVSALLYSLTFIQAHFQL